jgi:hypothetical protein
MNRMRLWPDGEPIPDGILRDAIESADLDTLAAALRAEEGSGEALPNPREAARTAVELAKRYASLVRQDERNAAPLREQTERDRQLFGSIPELATDVCDLDGLSRIGDVLFRGAQLPSTRLPATGKGTRQLPEPGPTPRESSESAHGE